MNDEAEGAEGHVGAMERFNDELMGKVAEEVSLANGGMIQDTEVLWGGRGQGPEVSAGHNAQDSGEGVVQDTDVFGGGRDHDIDVLGGGVIQDMEVLGELGGIGQNTRGEGAENRELSLVDDHDLLTEGRSLMEQENGISPKGATCDSCGQTFRDLFNLKRHQTKIHGNEMPVKCLHTYCSKGGYNVIRIRPSI